MILRARILFGLLVLAGCVSPAAADDELLKTEPPASETPAPPPGFAPRAPQPPKTAKPPAAPSPGASAEQRGEPWHDGHAVAEHARSSG